VVLTDGRKDTREYKRFRIRRNPPAGGPNDFAMMAEVVTRRFSHPEWTLPDLLVIDGGKGQLSATMEALSKLVIPSEVEGSTTHISIEKDLPPQRDPAKRAVT